MTLLNISHSLFSPFSSSTIIVTPPSNDDYLISSYDTNLDSYLI